MKALQIYETINFQRNVEPKNTMGTGLVGYEIPLKYRKSHYHFNTRDGIGTSRSYYIYQLLKYIRDNEGDDDKGEGVRFRDIVKKYYEITGDTYNRKTLSMGIWNSLKKYTFTRGESPKKPYTGHGILKDDDKIFYPRRGPMTISHTASRKGKTRYFINSRGYRLIEKYAPYFEK